MDRAEALPLSASEDVHAWLGASSDRVIETSCAWVALQGERALKVKKPVDYGFLDYSTPQKRRWALERELQFNRATAPDIYRAVHQITRESQGLRLDGPGEVVDWALEMRAFDPAAVLGEAPERVDGALAEELGRAIARFHAAVEVRPEGGGVKALGFTIRTNADNLRRLESELGKAEVGRLIAATDQALADHTRLLERRRTEGFARRCHGDLHLGNILLENGRPVLFDCIEFNDLLSEIDVLYDVAFTVMDLWFRGRREPANRLLNAYLDEAARSFPPDIWEGLQLLPLFLSARASVRTHVSSMQGDIATARAYLAAAQAHLEPPMPALTAIGGLSGTGKTTLARRVAADLGAAPGALVLRSDEIRKRLAGAAPTDKLQAEAYGPGTSEGVYAEMLAIARRALAAGRSVILDAVFLLPSERAAASALGGQAFVPFQGVWLQGEPAELRLRLAARTADASDADAGVLAEQLTRDPGPIDWLRQDGGDLEGAARSLVAAAA